MATVKAIKYGMKGDDVKNLQTTLNNLGYNLDVDGSFGPQTLSAVKQYQQKSGLDVDGMVGPQTQAKLFGGGSTGTSAPSPAVAPSQPEILSPSAPDKTPSPSDPLGSEPAPTPVAEPASGVKNKNNANIYYPDDFSYGDFSYGDYQESETVMQAQAALNAALAAQPGAYESKWQGQINEMIDRILNREKFTYDINSDALYQQYADQYKNLGKLAMQDTMGQAAAMTGGYGSSYAQSVGQQAYQGYLSQLNEMVPELYGMALDQYNREGQEMYNQYGLLSDQEQQDYGRYRDSYNQWLAEREYATGRYDSERDYDYGKYVDDRNFDYGVYADDRNQAYNEYLAAVQQSQFDAQYAEDIRQYNENMAFNKEQADIGNSQWEQSFEYQQDRDKVSDSQWQQNFNESQRQFNTSFNESKRQYEEAKASASSGSGGSGDSGSKAALEHVASMSSAEVVETMQGYSADGDNTGLAAFLDDCVASGRLTEAQADEYYVKYRKGNGHTITDTTVPTRSSSGVRGGSGGQVSYKY